MTKVNPTTINVSSERSIYPRQNAFDGDYNTLWGTWGNFDQWIEAVFSVPFSMGKIKMLTEMAPRGVGTAAQVWHNVIVYPAGRTVYEFDGVISHRQWIEKVFDPPIENVTKVRVLSLKSPNPDIWPAWKEIEIYSTPLPGYRTKTISVSLLGGETKNLNVCLDKL